MIMDVPTRRPLVVAPPCVGRRGGRRVLEVVLADQAGGGALEVGQSHLVDEPGLGDGDRAGARGGADETRASRDGAPPSAPVTRGRARHHAGRMRAPSRGASGSGSIGPMSTVDGMSAARARAFAQMRHADELELDGAPLIAHVGRVARMVPAEARVVAWLHEILESTTVSEQELLMEGLTDDELRALRLLRRVGASRSDVVYLAHLESVARAAGHAGRLARAVGLADLTDRCSHPRVHRDGWSPPYADALARLRGVAVEMPVAAASVVSGRVGRV